MNLGKVTVALRGWKTISVWDSNQPYMDRWWVPGMWLGYEHTFVHSAADFLADLGDGQKRVPDIDDGQKTQIVCDTILASAAKGQWMQTGLDPALPCSFGDRGRISGCNRLEPVCVPDRFAMRNTFRLIFHVSFECLHTTCRL